MSDDQEKKKKRRSRTDKQPKSKFSFRYKSIPISETFNHKGPEGVSVPFTWETLPDNSEKPKYLTLACLISHLMTERLKCYDQNRSGHGIDKCKLNPDKIETILRNFNPHSLAEISIGIEPNSGELTIADGHNRLQAICNRHFLGEMTEAEYKSTISVRFHDDFMEAYRNAGLASSHTSAEKILHKHMCIGHAIHNFIASHYTEDSRVFFTGRKTLSSGLRDFMFAIQDRNPATDWYVSKIYSRGGTKEMKRLENEPPGAKFFCPDKMKILADGMNNYVALFKTCEARRMSKEVLKLFTMGSFFFFFMYDHTLVHAAGMKSGLKFFDEDLAYRISDNCTNVTNVAKSFLNGRASNHENQLLNLYSLLNCGKLAIK